MSGKIKMALEMRRALQLFAAKLDAESEQQSILEIATLFPKFELGKLYNEKEIFSYGENAVGDPQLYQVLQQHTSAEQWLPDAAASLYKKIGVTDDGYPEWVQPLGAADAYNAGDVVSFGGLLYRSLIDGNVWSPESYPNGWEKI